MKHVLQNYFVFYFTDSVVQLLLTTFDPSRCTKYHYAVLLATYHPTMEIISKYTVAIHPDLYNTFVHAGINFHIVNKKHGTLNKHYMNFSVPKLYNITIW